MLVIIKSVDKLMTKTNSWPNLKIAFVLDIRQFMKTNTTRESPDQRPIGLKSITSDSICIKKKEKIKVCSYVVLTYLLAS